MTVRKYTSRSQQTTLTSAITSGATVMAVASASNLLATVDPASITAGATFTVVIDPDTSLEEIVDITSASSNTFNITRSVDAVSTAQDHSLGATVRHMITGRDLREANAHTEASSSVHGLVATSGVVVGTLATQTLSNKTLGSDLSAGTYKITNLGTPTAGTDAVTKTYTDAVTAAAATSAASAATSATSAAASATAAATSATSAATSATSSAASFTSFDQKYLGAKATAPTLDNQGGALTTGATYWNSTSNTLYYWTGSAWNTTSSYSAPTLGSTSIGSGATVANVNGLTINSTTIPTSKTLVATDSTVYVVPSQTGNSGKYLTTNGTASSWGAGATYLGAGSIASNLAIDIGGTALDSNTTGANNLAIGVDALTGNTVGVRNVAIGINTLKTATTNTDMVAIGYNTLNAASNASTGSVAIGSGALSAAGFTGTENIAVGLSAGLVNTTGIQNIAIGARANAGTTGGQNVVIGTDAGGFVGGSGNIVIGSSATPSASTVSQEITLGGASASTVFRIPGLSIRADATDFKIPGVLRTTAPVTKTGAFTVGTTENYIICNGTATFAITLPVSTNAGRVIVIKNIAAFTVTSASSNVYPINSATLGNAILPATAGSWVTLVGDGTNWVTMQS